jgi:hypothetical protein
MITADQLQEGLNKLREAVEAWAFALKAVPIQRGHLVLPDDEVTGEYLASLPVGLTLHERELAAARLDNLITIRRETSCFVRLPLSNEHSGKLITYELKAHDGHMHVTFNLSARPVDPETL